MFVSQVELSINIQYLNAKIKKYWSPTASQRHRWTQRNLKISRTLILICVFVEFMAVLYNTHTSSVQLNQHTDIQYFCSSWEMLLLTHCGLGPFCRCYLKTPNYCDMPTKATEGTIRALDRLHWNQLSQGAQMGSVNASFQFFSSTENW